MIIRFVNAKTKETEEIRFDPPVGIADAPAWQPTALKARHFTATYALHRVYSGRNLQYTLPPTHRPYWQAFEAIKKADLEKGLKDKYSEDPFQVQRDAIAAQAEKANNREKASTAGTVAATGVAGLSSSQTPRGWAGSPLVNMGKGTRGDVEKLIRVNKDWRNDPDITSPAKVSIKKELVSAGFRVSHAEEACEWASNLEDALGSRLGFKTVVTHNLTNQPSGICRMATYPCARRRHAGEVSTRQLLSWCCGFHDRLALSRVCFQT